MAFQTIQVNLEFNANTVKARQQMQELQGQLNSLITSQPTSQLSLTPQLQQAQQAAMQLRVALNNATNIDTGKLNLTKFQAQLKQSGMSLQQIAGHMRTLGPDGVRAFSQLTSTIAQADARMFQLGAKTKSFLTSIAHSAQYQMASSLIYGTINAFSKTLNYAKELDTSLNNIRIVTGKNADEMARFAKEANKAAKELSTTTTAYTDASLIYYQQGLNDKAVRDRTKTTVKLANVTGESAREVSEWMTAIWNNFYDGADSLESYADKLAKLGAATASSADEIAAGLEKFAAVAETVGLSYDYAASALATITAETRQSADVVGTALKTLFARIEGLKFGDTLEDGTTLNQYSEALSKVGVHIKDANGELKDMDTILTETGIRWNTLAKDEQVALAQSVAGIRQYTQFMALMDNWDVMEENLQMTKDANGELQKQEEIYETGAQAAEKRMQAAAEELKALIVGGDDLTKVYNFAGGALEVVSDLFDAFGGLKTILLGVAAALMNLYQPQIANFFSQMAVSAVGFGTAVSNGFHGKGFQANQSYKQDAVRMGANLANDALPEGSKESHYLKENAAIEEKLLTLGNSINASTKQRIEHEFELIKAKENLVIAMERELETQNDINAKAQDSLVNDRTKLNTQQVAHFASQATAKGAMEGYNNLAAENIRDVMNVGPLNENSRKMIVDKTQASLAKATTAATTGLPGEAGLGLDLDKTMIETGIDDEMISVTQATEQANQALKNYAATGQEDLAALLQLIEQINKAMSQAGSQVLDSEKTGLVEEQTFGEMGKKYSKPSSNPVDAEQVGKDLNKIDESSLDTKEVSYKKKSVTLDSMKKEVKEIENLRKSQAGLSKESKEYQQIEEQITKKTKTLNGQFNKFIKAQNSGAKTVERTSEATKELSNGLDTTRETAEKSGKAMVGVETASEEVQDNIDGLNGSLENGGRGFTHWSDTLVSGLGTMSSVAMGISMLTNSAEKMGEMFAGGEHSISGWISSIASMSMSLAMVVPGLLKMGKGMRTIIANRKLMNKLQGIGLKQDQIEMLLNKKKTAEEIAGDKKEMASDISAAMAENAKNLGKGPSGWAIFAAAAVGIAAIAAMIGVGAGNVSVQQQRESNDAEIEEAEGALEAAKGWNEEAQSMDDLISKHRALAEANDKTIEGQKALKEAQQAIIDQVPQLIEKYKELDKELDGLELSGDIALLEGAAENKDVEQIDEITNRIDEKAALETSKQAKEGQMGALSNLGLTIDETTGDAVSDGKITVHVGDVGKDKGENLLASMLGVESKGFGGGVDIELNMKDPKKFAETYEILRDFKKQMQEKGLTNDDTYREVNELLLATSEEYEKLKTLIEDGRTYEIQSKANAIDFDPSNIDTYEEYVNEKERLVKATVDADIATRAETEAWVAANKALSTYSALEKSALAYRDKYGHELYLNILEQAKTFSKEDLIAYLKIDFNKFQVEERWKDLKDYIKTLDKADSIQKNVTNISSAEKNLKSNGTREDYEKLQSSISWGEAGFIEFSTFLNKSYSEQTAYLENMKIKTADLAQQEYKAAQKKLDNTKIQYNNDLKNYKLKLKNAQLDLKEIQASGDQTAIKAQNDLIKTYEEKIKKIDVDLYGLDQEIEKTETLKKLAELEAKQAREARAKRIRDFKNSKQGYEDEYDAYKRLNDLSKDLSRTMTKIGEAKGAAYGGKYLALLNAEIKGLEVENQLLDKTIQLANQRAASFKKELISDYGVQFDESGNISNYNEIQGKYLQDLAEIEGSKGKDSEEYKVKKEEYDDFLRLSENYEKELEKVEEATDKKAENIRAALDKKLEGIQYVIDIKIEVSEGRLKILERLMNKLDDDALDGAARIINYQQQANQYINQKNTAKQGITDTLKANKVSDKDIQAYLNGDGAALKKYDLGSSTIDQLTTLTDQFTSAQDGLNEIDESVKNELMTTFNAWHDKIEDIGTSLQNYQSIMENYKNIVDTIGMKKLGLSEKDIRNMEEATKKTLEAQVANAKAQMDTTKAALEDVQKKKAGAKVGSEEYEYWEEREKELSRQLEEDTANATSLWVSAIENAYTTFEEQTQRAIDNFKDAVAGANFKSLDELQSAIDKQNQASERYLSNYEKAYELSKLNRNIQKEIDKIDDPRKKKALAELQEEIAKKTADGVKMSENDLRYLQQKYDLKVAEIALEEAQNAKSQVRLQKDSSGNFNYIYTADSNNVADAEQKYEDAMYAMEKSNEEYLNSLQEQIISNRQAMIDELSELNIQDFANAEEYEKAKADIIKYYTEQESYYMQEMQKQFGYNKKHYDQDVVFYSNYNQNKTGLYDQDTIAYDAYVINKKNKDKEIVDSFGETVLGMETGFSDIQGYHSAFLMAIGTAGENGEGGSGLLGDMGMAYNTLDSTINSLAETFNIKLGTNGDAQNDMTSFRDHVNAMMYGKDGTKDEPSGGIVGATNAATEATEKYEKTAKDKFSKVSTEVTNWYTTYGAKVQAGEQDTIALNTAINNLRSVSLTIDTTVGGEDKVKALAEAIDKVKQAIEKLQNADFKITATVKIDNSGNSTTKDPKTHEPNKKTIDFTSSNKTSDIATTVNSKLSWNKAFEALGRNSQEFTIYSRDYVSGEYRPGTGITAVSDGLDDVKFERINSYVHMGDDGKLYITAKVVKNSQNKLGLKEGSEYYVPIENLNTYGNADWLYDYYLFKSNKGTTVQYYNTAGDKIGNSEGKETSYLITEYRSPGNNQKNMGLFRTQLTTSKGEQIYLSEDWLTEYLFDKEGIKLRDVLSFYDTGGYTGEWGPEGRMAMLHQKEIVLNAHDTENFLKAIEIVRGISNRLDQQVSMMGMGLNGLFTQFKPMQRENDILQQEIHITAEFPNATNHDEIEEAFRNLPNLAAQYIYRS